VYDITPNSIGVRGGIASIKWNYSNYKLGLFSLSCEILLLPFISSQ